MDEIIENMGKIYNYVDKTTDTEYMETLTDELFRLQSKLYLMKFDEIFSNMLASQNWTDPNTLDTFPLFANLKLTSSHRLECQFFGEHDLKRGYPLFIKINYNDGSFIKLEVFIYPVETPVPCSTESYSEPVFYKEYELDTKKIVDIYDWVKEQFITELEEYIDP